MARYECAVCGYVYDESAEGAGWNELAGDWVCPVCAAAKSQFRSLDSGGSADESVAAASSDSAASPHHIMLAHRIFGYVFLGLYLVLIVQMIPRLWTYQIEFPARTVAHIVLGMSVGVVLLLKISIVRFFRRLDPALVPLLGTFLLVASVVLIGISVPSVFREAMAGGTSLRGENRQRVQLLLADMGLDRQQSEQLTTAASLREGQRILHSRCVDCHDLRTVLAKPRTPQNWRQTVLRMADRTTMMEPLDDRQQLLVTAYLVALSPSLQSSVQQLRAEQERQDETEQAAAAIATDQEPDKPFDQAAAQQLFEAKCSQCHDTSLVEAMPPSDQRAARALVTRMVDEGLEASQDELAQIVQYLSVKYGKAGE